MISRWQYYLLTINFILGTTLFVLIQRLVKQGAQDAWLMPLWAGSVGVFIALLWIVLARSYPGKSLVQIALAVCGRPLGIAISILYFLYFSVLAGWVLRNLSDFMNATIMQETPKSVFHIMFLLIACYTAAQGAEALARLNQLLTPFLFFPFWLLLLLAAVNWDWGRFQPVLQPGNWRNLLEFHSLIAFPYMETFAMMMLYPSVRQKAGRALVLGMVTASVSLSLILFMIIGLLGAERASRLAFPIYTAVQEVSMGEIIINIHSIISVVLLVLIFIKLLILVYGSYEILHQVFRPRTKWPHMLGLTILLSAIAMSIYENPIQNGEWDDQYSLAYDSFFTLSIPALLLAVTWLKRVFMKRRERSAD